MYHVLKHHLSKRNSIFLVLILLNFFFSAALSFTIYIDSSYLVDTIGNSFYAKENSLWSDPNHVVGTVYTIGSLFTILALMIIPYLLRSVGNYRTTLVSLILQVLILLGLGTTDSPWLIIPFFVIATMLNSIFYFNFDIFIERYSKEEDTGKVRGLFMTFGSIAWLLPPLAAGYIVEARGYQMAYIISALLVLPCLYLTFRYLHHFKDLRYEDVSVNGTHELVMKNKNLFNALVVNFFIHFFYAWMVIYAPIYLHSSGLSWEEIGLMTTLALTAFIIFPYPAGYIADRYLGEKELLIGGFTLMALSSALIPTIGIGAVSIILISLILFIGRTGASISETMSEAYYFKQIEGSQPQLVGYFRRTRPFAYVVAPILATVMLESRIITINGLFYMLAVFMILAIIPALRLKDTK